MRYIYSWYQRTRRSTITHGQSTHPVVLGDRAVEERDLGVLLPHHEHARLLGVGAGGRVVVPVAGERDHLSHIWKVGRPSMIR